ncbi:MAG TPA: hypothetical protein V6D25_28190 [Leptolyngbyaceae cyanobacterium]
MKPFVGFKEAISFDDLLDLIKEFANESSYYFLRWTHKVSGIIKEIESETDLEQMIEGQMFNYHCELRWKKKAKNTYEVLLLTIAGNNDDFIPVKQSIKKELEPWRIEPDDQKRFPSYAYPAYGYRPDEARFPKAPIYPSNLNIRIKDDNQKLPKLAQRYFIDKETSTVQFVALTVEVD